MVKLATENRDWGYRRIVGALGNLGHRIGRGTVANILERDPIPLNQLSPDRPLQVAHVVHRLMAKNADDRFHCVAILFKS